MTIKNRLSGAVKSKIKGRAKAKYAGQKGAGSVFARAKAAASKGKTLAQMGGKKTGWATGANKGTGVVKTADLATNKKTGKKATDVMQPP